MALQHDPTAPPELEQMVNGVGLYAAGANVIMQLAKLPVGRGVAESRVESGRVDSHPIKRLRTTLQYLAVALFGTDEDRDGMRREVNRSHRDVHSLPDDPVEYNAFDTDLQLWVAACLYKGLEDVFEVVWGDLDDEVMDRIYQHAAHLGTTLQVTREQWPVDREEFARYWEKGMAEIEMDDVTRRYLQGIAKARFLGRPWSTLAQPLAELTAVGFLPPEFREELQLPWTENRQRAFDALIGVSARMQRILPRPLRVFPFNVYLWDARRRIRTGKPIV